MGWSVAMAHLQAKGRLSSGGQDKAWKTSLPSTFRGSAAQATTKTSDLPLLESEPSSTSCLGREPGGSRMLEVASSSPHVPGGWGRQPPPQEGGAGRKGRK